ncbi:hypothetical protein [Kitasatospora sp. NPDC059327]|uniref:hypothetical protein n=1 Tax=Kitasatospora sp. NPDC059327 TaxID=3346803 RepID=UPI0036AD877F
MNPLDHLLAGGGMRAAAPTPVYDLAAGRRRIAEKIAAHQIGAATDHQDSARGQCRCAAPEPRSTISPPRLPQPPTPTQPPVTCPNSQASTLPTDLEGLTFHDHAERDLRTIATMITAEEDAAASLHRLINDHTVEPRGALVFACLLYLAGRYQEAQFWWQFAGGAEDITACFCLYLHHARLGELKAAEHWFNQSALLETLPPNRRAVPPTLPPVPDYYLACLPWVGQYLLAAGDDQRQPEVVLREALDDLDIVRDAEYGPISLPTDDLAEQLHDLVCP